MTVIGEHMFATGDDDGVVKCMLYMYCFFLFSVSLNPLYLYLNILSMGSSTKREYTYIFIKKNGGLCKHYSNK